MLIGELAARSGVSARALRHYEQRGVLAAERGTNGYRVYAEADVARVLRIKAMIGAGLTTDAIRRYLDCATSDDGGTTLEMCPGLRAEIERVSARLDEREAAVADTRVRLCALVADC